MIDGAYEPVLLGPPAPMTAAEVGPMICGCDVEDAVLATLRLWLPSYLAECDDRHGLERGATPAPRGWVVGGRGIDKFNEDQLPCVVLAGGILQNPRKEGPPGTLTGTWVIEVGTVFGAATWTVTDRTPRRRAQMYAAAIRTCLLQRPLGDLDTTVTGAALPGDVDLIGEVYDELDFADTRSYSASVVRLHVEVREIGWASGGPPPFVEPPVDPTQPPDSWPTVTDTDVTVNHEPIP